MIIIIIIIIIIILLESQSTRWHGLDVWASLIQVISEGLRISEVFS
jgi:hypothetical protein